MIDMAGHDPGSRPGAGPPGAGGPVAAGRGAADSGVADSGADRGAAGRGADPGADPGAGADRPGGSHWREAAVRSRTSRFAGRVFEVFTDEVAMPDGGWATRDYVRHVGAVGVVALDDADRVVLVRQHRHPVGARMWELPAGLLDQSGEPPAQAAARELAEEADLVAGRWRLLLDMHTTPGMSDEVIRLFLARELAEVPDGERFRRGEEEAELTVRRVDLDEAVAMALDGRITNGPCLAGVLAAATLRDRGFPAARPLATPLPRRPT